MNQTIPTFSTSIDITRNCNLRCKHCFNFSGENYIYPEMTDTELSLLPNQFKGVPIETVCLCGGEPLLKKDLVLLMISKLREAGIKDINLTSNGILMTPKYAEKLKENGIANVQISIDGNRTSHNWLRDSDTAYDGAINAISVLIDAGIQVGVACAPNKKNSSCIPEVIDLMESMGVSIFRMQPLMSLGRAKSICQSYMTIEEYMRLSMMLSRSIAKSKYKMSIEWGDPTQHLFYLGLGGTSKLISINAYGDILLSPYIPIVFGNIMNHSFKEYLDAGLRDLCKNNDVLKNLFRSAGSMITNSTNVSTLPELYREEMFKIDIIDDELDVKMCELEKLIKADI